jgi:hypothetical protein
MKAMRLFVSRRGYVDTAIVSDWLMEHFANDLQDHVPVTATPANNGHTNGHSNGETVAV